MGMLPNRHATGSSPTLRERVERLEVQCLRLVELAERSVERQDLLAEQLDEIERDLDAIFERRGRRWTAR